MGISIKREDTERLARQVAVLTGENLTDAIHNALNERIMRLGARPADELKAMQDWLRELDARPIKDDRSLAEYEKNWYDADGQPV